jgi:hypothetical protein
VLLDLCHVLSVLLSCALLVTVWSVNSTYSASSRIVIHTHRKHALLKVRYAATGLDSIFWNSPSRAVVNNTGFSLGLLIVKEKIDDVQCSQEHYHAKIQVLLKDFRGVSVTKRSRHMSRTSRGLMRIYASLVAMGRNVPGIPVLVTNMHAPVLVTTEDWRYNGHANYCTICI